MIAVKDLTFSYGKDKQALHGLNFTVEDGEIFGFLGPNGSGKSTTQDFDRYFERTYRYGIPVRGRYKQYT